MLRRGVRFGRSRAASLLRAALVCFPSALHGRAEEDQSNPSAQEYRSAEVFQELAPWVAAGAPRSAVGEVLDGLRRGASVRVDDEDCQGDSALCERRIAIIGMAVMLAGAILRGESDLGDFPWDYLLYELPWEQAEVFGAWPVFDLLGIWASQSGPFGGAHHLATLPAAQCDDAALALWASEAVGQAGLELANAALSAGHMASLPPEVVRLAAASLLQFLDVSFWGPFCGAIFWALLMQLLAMLPEDTLSTPGYALRLTHSMLLYRASGSAAERFGAVAAAPWPIFALLGRLVRLEVARLLPHRGDAELAPAAGMGGGPPPPFLSLEDDRARGLAETLRVTHTFLEALGTPYTIIAGTLLGALRHFDRIPWDDDADLCVDAGVERVFVGLVATQEARRSGSPEPGGVTLEMHRALRYLRKEGHVLRINAAQALVFVVEDVSGRHRTDIWLCWGLTDPEPRVGGGIDVALMSLLFGPRIPRALIFPRRKYPFGQLALWGPAYADEVLTHYVRHAGWSEDWRGFCRGRKVHGLVSVAYEYADEVPCISLSRFFTFVQPWAPPSSARDWDDAWELFQGLLAKRLPGLSLAVANVSMHSASLGHGMMWRLRAEGVATAAHNHDMYCEALVWRGGTAEEFDILDAGALLGSGVVVRSLVCGDHGSDPFCVWEGAWL